MSSGSGPRLPASTRALDTGDILPLIIAALDVCSTCKDAIRFDIGDSGYCVLQSCKQTHVTDLWRPLQVSKAWFSTVIPILWGGYSNSEWPLLALFREGTYGTKPLITGPRLERFLFYARHIKILELRDIKQTQIFTEVVSKAKSLNVNSPIFPTLRHLRIPNEEKAWTNTESALEILSAIMHPGLQSLDLEMPDRVVYQGDSAFSCQYLTMIAKHSPHLSHLALRAFRWLCRRCCEPVSKPFPLDATIPVLRSMSSLKWVAIPAVWASTAVLTALGSVPDLKELILTPCNCSQLREPEAKPVVAPKRPQGNGETQVFAGLSRLVLSGPPKRIQKIISAAFPNPCHVQTLILEPRVYREEAYLLQPSLYELVSRVFPRTTSITVDFMCQQPEEHVFAEEPIFAPLSALSDLVELSIENASITIDDIEDALGGMMKLKTLILTGPPVCEIMTINALFLEDRFQPHRAFSNLPGLYLGDLMNIAAKAPQLEHLKITLQVTDKTPGPVEGGSHFPLLKSFTIISSFINYAYWGFSVHRTAAFLHSMINGPNTDVQFIDDKSLYEGRAGGSDSDDEDSQKYYVRRYSRLIKNLEAVYRTWGSVETRRTQKQPIRGRLRALIPRSNI